MKVFFSFCSVLSLLLTLMLRGNLAKEGKVPVLLWSNDETLLFPNTFVGHTVSQNKFKDLYLDKLLDDKDIKTIVVFVQDKLTVGEISMNADVYANDEGGSSKHTRDLMSTLPSAFLSKVASPVNVLIDLKEHFPGKTYTLEQPYDLSALHLESADRNLVIVHLPPEHSSSVAINSYLQNVDDILNNVTLQLQGLSENFAALYTGKKAPGHTSFDQHSGRHLLEEESKQNENITGLFLEIPDFFMIYSSQISFVYNYGRNSSHLSLNVENWNITQDSDCPSPGFNQTSNVTCTLTLNYHNPVEVDDYQLENFALIMTFATTYGLQSGYWYLHAFSMSYLNSSLPVSISLDEKFIDWTPFDFSYHCHENPPIKPTKNESEFDPESIYLSFKAFQVQVFKVNGNFGYYNDCVGFFTIPIWSAIICCAVLLAILFFGIIMLMDIKTMDRLDDPKGKTISVTVAD